jgi:hypothetical protein
LTNRRWSRQGRVSTAGEVSYPMGVVVAARHEAKEHEFKLAFYATVIALANCENKTARGTRSNYERRRGRCRGQGRADS